MKSAASISKHESQIKSMFGSIASSYDLVNDLMTFGLARSWRKTLVKMSAPKPSDKILDCATGTGDLALEFARVVRQPGAVTGIDFCPEMLASAPAKATSNNLSIQFIQGDVLQLPFPDRSFDIISIGYGLRNVSDIEKALTEMGRVCRPGGQVLILETGASEPGLKGRLMRAFFKWVVPLVGGIFSGNRSAYDYLQASSNVFPARRMLIELIESTGLYGAIEHRELLLGASHIYRLRRLSKIKD